MKSRLLLGWQGSKRMLVVVAAASEGAAILANMGHNRDLAHEDWKLHEVGPRLDLVVCGIGKANAAGAVGRLLDGERHAGVVSAGVAGALPRGGLELGQVVVASASVYGDEGLAKPGGFESCSEMGFAMGPFEGSAVPGDVELVDLLRPLADRVGAVATVSTCSGTDALAEQTVSRTGALAEAMEGAAVGHVAARLGIPSAELRVISNTTGDRSRQRWDLAGALLRLGSVIGLL